MASDLNTTGGIWSEEDTTPGAIEAGIRQLLQEHYASDASCAPARVLNLVVVVDREWRGEILNRLERVGRYHPSRLILCAVEPSRTTIDAMVSWIARSETRTRLRMFVLPKPSKFGEPPHITVNAL